MTDRSQRFFAWVWRINGLLLLALALLAFAGLVALLGSFASSRWRDDPEPRLTKIAGVDLGESDLRLTQFEEVAGTGFLYAQLASERGGIASGSLSASYQERPRNLLFFEVATKHAHWLLPGNDRIIQSFSFFMDPPSRYYSDARARERDQAAVALLIESEPETNGEAHRSARRLAVASPDGRNLTPIAEPVDRLLGYHLPQRDSALVFYLADGAARVIDLDPIARKVRSDLPLSVESANPAR